MVEYRKHKDGDFWRLRDKECFIRDHPKWKEKHPLGPVSFDIMCPECDFIIEDTREDLPKKMDEHWKKHHAIPRLLAAAGVMWSEGEGI